MSLMRKKSISGRTTWGWGEGIDVVPRFCNGVPFSSVEFARFQGVCGIPLSLSFRIVVRSRFIIGMALKR